MTESSSGRRWGLLGLELLVVFVGVWLSLWAENWRQGRAAHAAELESLARIAADLESEISDIRGNWRRAEESHAAALWIEGAIDRGDAPTDSLTDALTLFQRCSNFVKNASEYSALQSSGRINSITNGELRQAIVSYYERHGYIQWLHEQDCAGVERTLDVLAPHVLMESYDNGFPDIHPIIRPRTSAARLLQDPMLSRALIRAAFFKRWTVHATDVHATQATELRVAILQELG